jgi:hypothetical protein
MIEPIEQSNTEEACELLARGFPLRPRDYWRDAFARIERFGENAATEIPAGLLLRDEGRPAGVGLTIASRRPTPDGRVLAHVNFAAWYVEEAQRWRAPLMLRALTRIKCDVITDLTPSTAVRALLPAFDFKPITTGFTLALSAFHGGGGHVENLEKGAGAPIASVLLAHREFGALPALLRSRDGADIPLLFRITSMRGLKTAHVVYCASNSRLHRHLGAVSSCLRARGVVLIKLDAPVGVTPPGFSRAGREVKFARGQVSADVTDYTGTELSLLAL